MTELGHYLQDGASIQSRAVLAFLSNFTIEESWSDEYKFYRTIPEVSRWQNCREQGYVICMRAENLKQINIAFFEHRNSDNICAIKWEESTINSPTIDSEALRKVYKDKWSVSHSVGYGEVVAMSEWIKNELHTWWLANRKKK